MYPNRNFSLKGKLPLNEKEIVQDLEINTLIEAMAWGGEFLWEVA